MKKPGFLRRVCNNRVMTFYQMPTHQRCPQCMGRGTNSRGSLCSLCNGIGEVPIPARMPDAQVVPPKRQSGSERPFASKKS